MEGLLLSLESFETQKDQVSGLHSDDVLLDILKPHETSFEAVPTDAGDNGDHFPVDNCPAAVLRTSPVKEDRQDKLCNFFAEWVAKCRYMQVLMVGYTVLMTDMGF